MATDEQILEHHEYFVSGVSGRKRHRRLQGRDGGNVSGGGVSSKVVFCK